MPRTRTSKKKKAGIKAVKAVPLGTENVIARDPVPPFCGVHAFRMLPLGRDGEYVPIVVVGRTLDDVTRAFEKLGVTDLWPSESPDVLIAHPSRHLVFPQRHPSKRSKGGK